MAKFRKKPVEIEAVQWRGSNPLLPEMFMKGSGAYLDKSNPQLGEIVIPTLEGIMRASVDDWIIKGVNGEFYPCKPDIFQKTYEEVIESDFITRLFDERDQLSERIEKLKEFIRSGKVYEIDEVQQVLLYAQLPAMRTYLDILNQRIDRL